MYNVYCLVIRRGQGTIVKYVVNKYLVSEDDIQLRERAKKNIRVLHLGPP